MLLSGVVCLVGLIIYFFTADGRVQKISGDMFWVGLLVFLLQSEPYVNKLVIR